MATVIYFSPLASAIYFPRLATASFFPRLAPAWQDVYASARSYCLISQAERLLDEAVQKYPDFAKVRVTNYFKEPHANQNKYFELITFSAVKLIFIYLFIYFLIIY